MKMTMRYIASGLVNTTSRQHVKAAANMASEPASDNVAWAGAGCASKKVSREFRADG